MKKNNSFYLYLFTFFCVIVNGACTQQEQDRNSLPTPGRSTNINFVPDQYRWLYHAGNKSMGDGAKDLDITAVSMKRTPCFGKCPVYTITFNKDQKASYNGTRFVEKEGHFNGIISLTKFGRLCYFVEKIGFKKFNDQYRAPWTDDSGVIITVDYKDGTQKKVSSYGNYGPIKFWGLTMIIDNIADAIQWEK